MGCFSAEHLEAWSCADPWSCSTQWGEYHKEAGRRKVNWCLIGVEVRTPVLRVMRAEKRSWPSGLATRLTTDRAQRGNKSRLHRKTGTMWQTWGTVSDTEPAGSSASVQGLWQGGVKELLRRAQARHKAAGHKKPHSSQNRLPSGQQPQPEEETAGSGIQICPHINSIMHLFHICSPQVLWGWY